MGSGAGLSGCHACIKYLMFAFNFIFWLIGCALVGLGIWVLVDGEFKDLAKQDTFQALEYAGVALTVVGAIIMVIGFFGCCGAIRESQCLLVMFFICLFILFAGLVGAGAYWLIGKESFIKDVTKQFEDGVDKYSEGAASDSLVDLVQSFFKCCGVSGHADYTNVGKTEPTSCPNFSTLDTQHKNGCPPVVKDALDKYSLVVAGVAIGSGVIMLLGMIFAMLLCCAIRDSDD